MPVIVNAADLHPFLPSLGSPEAIEAERAAGKDVWQAAVDASATAPAPLFST